MPITYYFTTFVGYHHIHEYNQGNHSQERMKWHTQQQKGGGGYTFKRLVVESAVRIHHYSN